MCARTRKAARGASRALNACMMSSYPCAVRSANSPFRPHVLRGSGRRKNSTMSAFVEISDELIGAVEMSMSGDRDVAVCALGIVRDGVITGEGPTTRGRIHFSRALDARDAAWCARILTATAVADEPVSRAEAEALFEINAVATERSDK